MFVMPSVSTEVFVHECLSIPKGLTKAPSEADPEFGTTLRLNMKILPSPRGKKVMPGANHLIFLRHCQYL